MATNTPRLDRVDKNFLINGAFDLFQRVNPASNTNTTTGYTYAAPDRWLLKHTGTFTGTPNVTRSTTLPNFKTPNSILWNFQRNASTAVFDYQQRIAANNAVELVEVGVASFSFKVNISVTGATAQLILAYPTVTDNHASQTTISTSATVNLTQSGWTTVTFENVSIPSNATTGLAVILEITLPSSTDGSGQTLYMTQAMCNAGMKASGFARSARSRREEIVVCQAYYEKSYDIDTVPGTSTTSGANHFTGMRTQASTATLVWGVDRYKINKRSASGTLTIYSTTGASGNVRNISAAADTASATESQGEGSHGVRWSLTDTNVYGWHFTIDSEIN